jgi:hypothetical protein
LPLLLLVVVPIVVGLPALLILVDLLRALLLILVDLLQALLLILVVLRVMIVRIILLMLKVMMLKVMMSGGRIISVCWPRSPIVKIRTRTVSLPRRPLVWVICR